MKVYSEVIVPVRLGTELPALRDGPVWLGKSATDLR